MSVDLGETNIDPESPAYRRMLENLQSNILKPHGRTESNHIFLHFKAEAWEVSRWIHRFAREDVTSAKKQLEDRNGYREAGRRGGLVVSFFLTANGYEALGFDPRAFGGAGQAFRSGMKHRALSRIAGNRDPPPSDWEEPYRGDIHALMSLAHDSADEIEAKTAEVSEDVRGIATILAIERGTVLRNANGEAIEHFGYVDARSQPLFLRDDIEAERNVGIGAWDPSAPLRLVLVGDPLADEPDSFGSYFVFRKLLQDVDGFNAGVRALASSLAADESLTGAMVVGRFKDGTPVTLQPLDGLGSFNNFEYLRQDHAGNRCPFHAHIRKANQRGANPLLSDEDERSRRIVRRGVPYGVRPAPATGPSEGPPAAGERGLLFMCFQGDIGRQFEFIQRAWVDNPNFPEFLLFSGLNTGDDALIGQHPRAVQKWPKEWGQGGRFQGRLRFNFGGYVRLRGGEYFFAPSLSFLRTL